MTLVTVGSEDILTPIRFANELATLIPGARLEVIPGAGHGALWEAPAAFNAACLAFLDAVDPVGDPAIRRGGGSRPRHEDGTHQGSA